MLERLALEIFQAGLSWLIVLKKRPTIAQAFDHFAPATVAAYDQAKITELLANPGIIRNRLKIQAIIHNAGIVLDLQRTHGSFAQWLDAQGPLDKPQWIKLFKQTFRFTGAEVVNEFLMSINKLPGAHRPDCPVTKLIR